MLAPHLRNLARRARGLLPVAFFAICVIGMRIDVFLSAASQNAWTEWRAALHANPGLATIWSGLGDSFSQLLYSVAFDVLVVVLLCIVAQRGAVGRFVARVGLAALLVGNVVATAVFHHLNTYVRGYELTGFTWHMVRVIFAGSLTLPKAAALTVCLLIAAFFQPRSLLESARLHPFVGLLTAALVALCGIGVRYQIAEYKQTPAPMQSPILLAILSRRPRAHLPQHLPAGKVSDEDWSPASGFAPGFEELARAPRRLNVVMVVLESVRADRFWPSPGAPPMPRLAALADRTAVFTRAYAHEPRSIKSLSAFLFGTYPFPSAANVSWEHSDIALESFASRWAEHGLRSAYFHPGDLNFEFQNKLLANRGFEQVVDQHRMGQIVGEPGDRALVKALDQFIEKDPNRRFGAVLWAMQAHVPYALPAPLKSEHPPFSEGAYLDCIRYLDDVIGDLTDMLARRHLLDDTVIVLVGDHGQSFGEHPESGLAHGRWDFEESVHVPLILINGRLFHGQRDARVVQLKDVAPTLAWLAGDPRTRMNQADVVFLQRPSETAYLQDFIGGGLRGAVVHGNWKYHYASPEPGGAPEERLYDLSSDPTEQHDLSATQPREVVALRERYFGWLRRWDERWRDALNVLHYRDHAAVTVALEPDDAGARAPRPAAALSTFSH